MSAAMQELLAILDLEALEHNLFRGRSHQTSWLRVFGGQVIAQALTAAQRTVEDDRPVHSLHAYFMLPGDPAHPIVYQVERLRDGGSFTTRRVTAIQRGKAIFSLEASFHVREGGLDHQIDMPGVAAPETLLNQRELAAAGGDRVPAGIRRFWERDRPIEIKPVALEHFVSREKLAPRQDMWVRAAGPVPADRRLRAVVLAYLSDMTLLDTATYAHGRGIFDADLQAASLDHAMWFHRDADPAEWMLYTQDSPSASGARGFTRGSLYTREGVLVASVAQEGLIRIRQPHKK